ncbi:MAG: phosphate transport system substrate-binding protein, partial [Myxococcota bacterium]
MSYNRLRNISLFLFISAALAAFPGCKKGEDAPSIKIDGSSTVYPISEAVAEEFQKQSNARITIAVSGTGGGFKKFCVGETAITGASREIKKTEIELCKKNGIEYARLSVAYDGISVVVHKDNTWVDKLTIAELKTIWEPEAQRKIMTWNQVREGFPNTPLRLYGAGVDSGTYDYFTKVVVGTEHASRGDYVASEDDNVLVAGVAGDKGGLAFFGFAYYMENKDKLKIVPIDAGKGAIAPTRETVADGSYAPLSRPIFIYVSKTAAKEPAV